MAIEKPAPGSESDIGAFGGILEGSFGLKPTLKPALVRCLKKLESMHMIDLLTWKTRSPQRTRKSDPLGSSKAPSQYRYHKLASLLFVQGHPVALLCELA